MGKKGKADNNKTANAQCDTECCCKEEPVVDKPLVAKKEEKKVGKKGKAQGKADKKAANAQCDPDCCCEDEPVVGKQLMAEMDELGDKLAKREGYQQVSGLEAVWYYLIQKYHWTPKKVRAMGLTDIYFCMKEEQL